MNAGIPSDLTLVYYASVDDAIAKIKQLGPGCFLARTDIKSVFRIIPLHPSHYHLLGIKWKNQHYFDKRFSVSCASSCGIFETFSTLLELVAKRQMGAKNVVHILDDFSLWKEHSISVVRLWLLSFHVVNRLGFLLQWKKLWVRFKYYHSVA